MTNKEQDTIRLIKDLSSAKKKLKNIRTAAELKQQEIELMLKEVEEQLCVSKETLVEIGRIAARRFGLTITPEKFEEELNFIFSDSIIAEYVDDEKKTLPHAEELAELDKVLNGSEDKPAEKDKNKNAVPA
ncbi:hypothetical protein SAMN02910317_00506 [Ruminococcaceae bacterium FB2012]|nr:hypothetical protein SAMN02910317_00506 [Ruminococcaceae bacterium FB2012]